MNRLERFLFTAQSDQWLTLFRVGFGFQTIAYSWSLRTDWTYLFASNGRGLISRDLAEAILSIQGGGLIPRMGWLVTFGDFVGLSEETVLLLSWIFLFGAGCCLLVGIFSRPAAIVAWFLHLCAAKSGGLLAYGVDNFATIGLFYLALSPLPDTYSLDFWIWKKRGNPKLVGFYRRVLQLHLCFIYFFGGLAKCLGPGWWNGESLWRALTRPPFDILPIDLIVRWRDLLPFAGIAVCLLEIGFPFLIWPKRTRLPWLACTIALHLGIGLTMGMYLFSFTMIILNLAAFAPDILPRRTIAFPSTIDN